MVTWLKNTIVAARDKAESARFYERIFGCKYERPLDYTAE